LGKAPGRTASRVLYSSAGIVIMDFHLAGLLGRENEENEEKLKLGDF
jgi:ornithine cyclodeaminase/alanine dehydrogenase-like protein (mu-crystallin family)